MKSQLFKTVLTGVVAGAIALGAGMTVQAAPLPQDQIRDQGMDKPSPDVGAPADQGPPAEQAAPQSSAPQPAYQNQAPMADSGQGPSRRQYSPLSNEQLQQLVAPIALYPDALVAQILAASSYPTQIVQAGRFLKENPDLKGQALGTEVDRQDWDPSVKALTQFPTVVANLDRDLSWTQELGDANYNQSADVRDAIQYMRRKAREAGNLQTTPQQRVYDRDDQVQIDPVDPEVVYVPQYNPAYVYGYPVAYWPGFSPWWGFGGPYISFGFGFPISPFFGFGWGWHGWGLGWGFHGGIFYGGRPWGFRGAGFYNRNAFNHGNYRGYARGGVAGRGYAGRGYSGRGYSGAAGRGSSGSRNHTGNRSYSGSGRGYSGSGNRSFSGRGTSNERSGSSRSFGNSGGSRGYSSGARSSGYSGGSHASSGGRSSSGGGHSSGGHSGGGGHSSSGGSGHGGGGGHSGGGHGR